ncbi:MAG: AI-2E family transporter [Rhizobacter sp.]|nr:AI-2E family transporter [Bacteriovorax sp.]
MIEKKIDLQNSSATRLLILPVWLIAIYAIGCLITETATVCLWMVNAFFLFVLLDPIAEFLKKKKWSTTLSALFVILVATGLIVLVTCILGSLFSGVYQELDQSKKIFSEVLDSLNNSWTSWNTKITNLVPGTSTPHSNISKVEIVQTTPFGGEIGGTIIHGLGSAATVFTFILLVPVLAFFLLVERDGLGKIFTKAYNNPETAGNTWKKIVRSTKSFFLGNLILAAITYPIFALLFYFFAVPSIFTTAALATFFNIIPFAGAVLSGILPAIGLYTQTQTIGGPLIIYGLCVAIHFFIADFITPKILGSQVNINATTSTIALIVWGELWGGVGLILAIPITSVIKILFESSDYFWLQWIAGLMSADMDEALRIPGQETES